MRLTPEPKRSALFTLYAWMRAADDIADGEVARGNGAVPSDAPRRLQQFLDATRDAISTHAPLPAGPIWPAFRQMTQTYEMPTSLFEDAIRGQFDDLSHQPFATFDQLYTYCRRVASTVGLGCVLIWGAQDAIAHKLTEHRGVALQLTNILRDLSEDAQRGRCYLPTEDLARYGIQPSAFLQRKAQGESFERFMRFQIERAMSYYQMSSPLEQHLHPDGRRSSWLIAQTYRQLLQRIARRPGRVLQTSVSLGTITRLRLLRSAFCQPTR
jgi:phytoene synthase